MHAVDRRIKPSISSVSRCCARSPRVSLPGYRRDRIRPGVVHLGLGGFHRAHQAVYFDDLAHGGHTDWGIVGVGIRRPEVVDALTAQDNMFTVVERAAGGSRARVLGSVVRSFLLARDPEAVLQSLMSAETKLVTLTITADGYACPDNRPSTDYPDLFALVVQALAIRRRRGMLPFTILSCDNLPDSSAAARRAVLNRACQLDPTLSEWIDSIVSFPASMVDRITPAGSADDHRRIRNEFHVSDRSPVVTERFRQWIIQNDFCNKRPPLDEAGARFVPDVAPYKLIKSRLLNGVHSALGYVGNLAGHRTTAQVMKDPLLREFVERLMVDEISPLLPQELPGMELRAYRRTVLERLSNPAISDPLSRLCRRGSSKMTSYLLPSLVDARRQRLRTPLLTITVAAWLRYASQHVGAKADDVRADDLAALYRSLSRDDGSGFASDIFGVLRWDTELAAEVSRLIRIMDRIGIRAALADELRPDEAIA
jgi:mannitol-1-phosphate/altronate dehydrogenase